MIITVTGKTGARKTRWISLSFPFVTGHLDKESQTLNVWYKCVTSKIKNIMIFKAIIELKKLVFFTENLIQKQ
jgi:hypothetical protein